MASYRTGTVAVTNGSKIVTGTDTAFNTAGVYAGDIFALVDTNGLPTGSLYEVESVQSDTKLTLRQSYQGTTGTAKSYVIMNMAGNQTTPRFAARVSSLLDEIQPIADGLSESALPGGIPKGKSTGQIDRAWLEVFGGSSSSAAGTKGAVPAPPLTNQPYYLLSNGSWARSAATTFVGDENIDMNNLTDSGTYAFLTSAIATLLNAPAASVGILEVIGNNYGQLYQRYTTYSCVVYVRRGAKNGSFTDWIQIGPPYAQTEAGIGQWVALSSDVGVALNLPAGGTWAYALTAYTSAGALAGYTTGLMGVKAGGSNIVASNSAYKLRGFCWRVA